MAPQPRRKAWPGGLVGEANPRTHQAEQFIVGRDAAARLLEGANGFYGLPNAFLASRIAPNLSPQSSAKPFCRRRLMVHLGEKRRPHFGGQLRIDQVLANALPADAEFLPHLRQGRPRQHHQNGTSASLVGLDAEMITSDRHDGGAIR